MYRKFTILLLTALMAVFAQGAVRAQSIAPDYDDESVDGYQYVNREYEPSRARIDRYLDVEVWTNHSDGEFYVGDNVVIKFRTNRDAFLAIYSIDTRGRVNLLFPIGEGENNFIEGGTTYKFPGGSDDFDLAISGPEGVETIQIIASREKFPIPDWYPTSGLIADWEEQDEYLDYVNNRYFVRYDGQRFAYDRTALYVNEWEENYFQPVYYPYYPSWTVSGNIYIDYPIGSSIYINGIYWGCTPLYIPRIYVGWHTFTVYDPYGYCWESDVHVYRHHTVVLDHHVVRPKHGVTSKYKEVRYAGYRNPVSNGYPDYKTKSAKIASVTGGVVAKGTVKGSVTKTTTTKSLSKKYVRGETKVTKTDRGFESVAPSDRPSRSKSGKIYSGKSNTGGKSGSKSTYGSQKSRSSGKSTRSTTKSGSYDKKSTGSKSYYKGRSSSSSKGKSGRVKKSGKSGGTSKQIKKSGSSSKKSGSGKTYKTEKSGSSKGSKSSGSSTKSTKSTKSSSGKSKSSGSKGKR